MKKILFFSFSILVVCIVSSCKSDKSEKKDEVSTLCAESLYFFGDSLIKKIYFYQEYMYTNSGQGYSESVYRAVLKNETYSKEYVKEHRELKDAFLTSLVYRSLYADFNGRIEEVGRAFIVDRNISVVYENHDSLVIRTLDQVEIPKELIGKGTGLFVLKYVFK